MSGKPGKIYLTICILCSCVFFFMILAADYQGIFRKENRGGEDGLTAEGQQMLQTGQSQSLFYQRDASLDMGIIELTLPFRADAEDVISSVSVTDGNVTQITISKEKAVNADGVAQSLTAYLYEHPIREYLSQENADLQLAETAQELTISYASGELCECEVIEEPDAAAAQGSDTDENLLRLRLVPIREKYEKIVVLDAGHGGSDEGITVDGLSEKDLTLAVVKKAGILLKKAGIQVYYTRTEDETVEQPQRAQLANRLRADMLISVHAAQDEDSGRYGMRTKYNDTFFIPGFSSADLGYILLEKVAASTNEKALGIEADTQEQVIRESEVPVALLEIGYLSNAQERKLLEKKDYLDRIAQGICDALTQSFEEME